MTTEFVYFAQGKSGHTKIGHCSDVERRLNDLRRTEKDGSIVALHVIPCESQSPWFLESAFHYRFRDWNHHGEWFGLNPEELDWAKTIKRGDQEEAIVLISRWRIEGQAANMKRIKWLMFRGLV